MSEPYVPADDVENIHAHYPDGTRRTFSRVPGESSEAFWSRISNTLERVVSGD